MARLFWIFLGCAVLVAVAFEGGAGVRLGAQPIATTIATTLPTTFATTKATTRPTTVPTTVETTAPTNPEPSK